MTDETPDVQLALVLETGAESADIGQRLAAVIQMGTKGPPATEGTLEGAAVRRAAIPETPLEVIWGAHKNRFFAALGEPAARKIIARLNGQGTSLADAAELKFDRAKVKAGPAAARLEAFVDVPTVVARVKKVVEQKQGPLPPEVEAAIQAMGIGSIKSLHARLTNDGMSIATLFVHVDGPMDGLLSLWRQQPLSDDDLKIVPRDARWAAVWNLDLKGAWDNTLLTAKKIKPEFLPMIQGGIMMAAGAMGFTSLDEMWSIFGDTWAVYDAPDHGGLVITGAVLVAEVKNRQALEGVLSRVVNTVNTFAKSAHGKVTLVQKEMRHGEHTIQYFLVGGVPCPVAPAWCFTQDRWVFGLFPQTVAEAMKQVDAATRKSSLLDHPDFQAARKLSPAAVQGLVYVDIKSVARLLYPLGLMLQTAGVSQLAAGGLSLDLQPMGTLPETLQDVHNSVCTSSAGDDGILYVSAGSGSGILAVPAAAAVAASIGLPTVGRARHQARQVAGASNLRQLGVACIMYASNNDGRFPASLEELVERGQVTANALRSPGRPPGAASYVYVAGQTSASQGGNVLVYERPRGDGRVTICFLDGHVETKDSDAFRQALLATYQRLGREGELPPDLRP
jgi:prepilin-type processing-associated H-X9-DG protein